MWQNMTIKGDSTRLGSPVKRDDGPSPFFGGRRFRSLCFPLMFAAFGVLSGCGTFGGVERPTFNTVLEADAALAVPGVGGPEVVHVVERRYVNGIEQTIGLATRSKLSGENFIRASFYGAPRRDRGARLRLDDDPVTRAGIRAEMADALPGASMRISPYYVQNGYGPFGYAVGRPIKGELCLYAWQRLEGRRGGAPFFNDTGSVQLRLRLCETGASEEELLSVFYNITIIGFIDDAGWNPYGAALGPNPSIGMAGQPLSPVGTFGFQEVLAGPSPAPSPRVSSGGAQGAQGRSSWYSTGPRSGAEAFSHSSRGPASQNLNRGQNRMQSGSRDSARTLYDLPPARRVAVPAWARLDERDLEAPGVPTPGRADGLRAPVNGVSPSQGSQPSSRSSSQSSSPAMRQSGSQPRMVGDAPMPTPRPSSGSGSGDLSAPQVPGPGQ